MSNSQWLNRHGVEARQPRCAQPTTETAMNYMLLIHESASDFAARTDPARQGALFGAYRAYTEALTKARVFVGGAPLQPPEQGAVVRQRDGKRQVQDGPFAEAKEQLGGYYVIGVAGLDQALEWAARCPAASYGSVEVRPYMPPYAPME
jgi:hypothetical protein